MLEDYQAFNRLPDDAKERVRQKSTSQRVENVNTSDEVEVSKRVAAATDHVIATRPWDEPLDPDADDYAKKVEDVYIQTEFIVSRYYWSHPAFVWAHLLFGADQTLREIVDTAADIHHDLFSVREKVPYGLPPDHVWGETHDASGVDGREVVLPWEPNKELVPIVYSTSRWKERWIMRGDATFHSILETIKSDPHCDLKMYGDTCYHFFDRADAQTIAENVYSFPFARGDMIIVARFCRPCFHKFLEDNGIEPKKCQFRGSYDDGFGQL